MPLSLELPGAGEARAQSDVGRAPARRLRPAPPARRRRARPRGGRRLDRAGQVDARQQPRRRRGERVRACCARRPAARCSCTIPTPATGSRTTGSCPGSLVSAAARRSRRPPRAGRSRQPFPPTSPCSTRRTSTPSSTPTGRWPPSCSTRPTCGCSSRPRPATPTRCPGSSSAAPSPAGVGIGLVLNRVPPGRGRRDRTPPGRDAAHRRARRRRRSFTIEEQPLADGRLPAAAVQPLRRGSVVSPPISRPGPSSSDAPWSARSASWRSDPSGSPSPSSTRTRRSTGSASGPRDAFDRAAWNIAVDVRDGTVMRGEVLARWQDVVGTGELLRPLQSTHRPVPRPGRRRRSPDRPRSSERFQGAVDVRGRDRSCVERVAAGDRRGRRPVALAAGRAACSASRPERRRSHAAVARSAERTSRMVRDWQAGCSICCDARARASRRRPRCLSYGVNGVALVLMVGVFVADRWAHRRRGRDRRRSSAVGSEAARGTARGPGGAPAHRRRPQRPRAPRRRADRRRADPLRPPRSTPPASVAERRRARCVTAGDRLRRDAAAWRRRAVRAAVRPIGHGRLARAAGGAGEIATLAPRAGARRGRRAGSQRPSHGRDGPSRPRFRRTPSWRWPAPTGSGKSSTFNALAGRELATTGVRRPTTSTTQAAVFRPQLDAAAPTRSACSTWLGRAPHVVVDDRRWTGSSCSTCRTTTRPQAAHRAGGRPPRAGRRRVRVGGRSPEVRRRRAAPGLPAALRRPRRRDHGGAQPDRHDPAAASDGRRSTTWRDCSPRTGCPSPAPVWSPR